ncbi:hypothetical protein ACI7RC_18105 [Brevibacillus sp. B_LB10_24]|uniref:hypothetical protein n=1 Tax=Brevibacillus sp. B_LB10_24 TaxID=3380645 RepID=UPI0038BD8B28
MESVQFDSSDVVSAYFRQFHEEIEQLAGQFALKPGEAFPATRRKTQPFDRAEVEYTLWGQAGVVSIKGNFPLSAHYASHCETIPVTMRFSLSYSGDTAPGDVKRRVEEQVASDVEIDWSILPAGHDDHLELSLRFLCRPQTGMLCEYARDVLGIITRRIIAA